MQRLMATTLGCEGQRETLLSMNIDRKKDKMEGTAGLLGARGGLLYFHTCWILREDRGTEKEQGRWDFKRLSMQTT